MPILALPFYAALVALLALLVACLLILEAFSREWARALAVGLVLTAAFCYGLDRWAVARPRPGAATPAPGMVAVEGRGLHPSVTPSEKKLTLKIFHKIKIKPKTFEAPYGTKLVRANYAVTHLLMSAADLRTVYFNGVLPDQCRDADHAIECACSKADDCSNAPR